MNTPLSRRALLKQGVTAVLLSGAGISMHARAADALVPLDPADPTAKALGYVTASANPQQNCANCAQYKGSATAASGPCGIFPGKQVTAAGYCKAWVKRAG